MEKLKKKLEIDIVLTSDNTFDLEIYEPESGDFNRIKCHYDGSQVDTENCIIVNEIRSWAEMMLEEQDFNKVSN